jgi:hypothetical protein
MIETRSIASVRRRCDEGKGQAAQSKRGNVNRDEDIELLNVEFDVVEDIPAELEEFISWSGSRSEYPKQEAT